jgi:SAM domain (Sterile alpha motif)
VDIETWLRSIGLEQYEQTFLANAIDADVLADLTDSDLEKLGVLLGHRKRMLKAIAALSAEVKSTIAPEPAALGAKSP